MAVKQVKQMDDMNPKTMVRSGKPVHAIAIGFVILSALLLLRGKLSIFGFDRYDDTANIELEAGSPEKFAVLSGKSGQSSVGST